MTAAKIGLILAALLPHALWADGGEIEYRFEITIEPALQIVPTTTFFPEAQNVMVVAAIRNASGEAWRSLDIRIYVQDQLERIQPSSVGDSIRIGQHHLPYAAWKSTLELRINGVYAGRLGGNWDIEFMQNPETLKIRFIEPTIQPGDEIQLRFPISDKATQWWSLGFVAHPDQP